MATKKNTTTNLHQQLAHAKSDYQQTILDIKSGQQKNTNAARQYKKSIAQIKTKLTHQKLTN